MVTFWIIYVPMAAMIRMMVGWATIIVRRAQGSGIAPNLDPISVGMSTVELSTLISEALELKTASTLVTSSEMS
jgi:hypothetical protein